jgi:hypothetical protein
MGFWGLIKNPAAWYYWTTGGMGTRDGLLGFPGESHKTQIEIPGEELGNLSAELEKLKSPEMAADDAPSAPGAASDVPGIQEQLHSDDYERAIAALDAALARHGHRLPGVGSGEKAALLDVMASVLRSKTKAASDRAARKYEVGQLEAEWISLGEKEIDALLNRWHARKNHLETHARHAQVRLAELRKQWNELDKQHKAKGHRIPHRKLPTVVYGILLMVVGALELPMNLAAFGVLREPRMTTLLMALGPSFAIIILAHTLGKELRQWPEKKPRRNLLVLIGVVVIALVLGLFSIGYLRSEYTAYLAKASHLRLDEMIALLCINLLYLAGGLVASFAQHDPDGELEHVYAQKHHVRRRLSKVWNEWSKCSADYDALRGRLLAQVHAVRHRVLAEIHDYRHFNQRATAQAGKSSAVWLNGPIAIDIFVPRTFDHELEHAPPTLDAMLKESSGEEAPAMGPARDRDRAAWPTSAPTSQPDSDRGVPDEE